MGIGSSVSETVRVPRLRLRGAGAESAHRTTVSRLDPYPIRAVHLTALWAYGVTQPVFSFVDGNPELLALNGASRADLLGFAVVLGFGPPLVVTAYSWLASRVSSWVGDMLFLAFLGVFAAPLVIKLVRLVDLRELLEGLAVLALCAGCAAAYARWRAVRLFLAFSLVLPIVGLASFLRGAPVAEGSNFVATVDAASPAPVVVVVLDELPLSSLLVRPGEIDAVRFPNFARLARDATWYPNATTVHERTVQAVPAILSGRMPRRNALPVLADHPENVFTLLGSAYSLDVHETVTALCPRRFCPRGGDSSVDRIGKLLADVGSVYADSALHASSSDGSWQTMVAALRNAQASRTNDFRTFIGGLSGDESTKTLHFLHVMLPHAPYELLPSGHSYRPTSLEGLRSEVWDDDPWLVVQGYQRHLLQVEYTDRLIGQLSKRLRRVGLFDRALMVVVADHGASFKARGGRRPLTKQNFGDIANVPLFVKFPHQTVGHTDTHAARTIDVLPTIADVLGIRVPWRVDGKSLTTSPAGRRYAVVARGDDTYLHYPMALVKRQRTATLRWKDEVFGHGRHSLYRIGVNRDLIGSHVASFSHGSRAGRLQIEDSSLLMRTRISAPVVPVRISGVVTDGEIEPDVELAIAVNHRIEALTRCFPDAGKQRFRALVPESSLHDGSNSVDVFAIEGNGASRGLVWLGGTPS